MLQHETWFAYIVWRNEGASFYCSINALFCFFLLSVRLKIEVRSLTFVLNIIAEESKKDNISVAKIGREKNK